jgi:uncharacterized protein YgfB (UPF0149 family)
MGGIIYGLVRGGGGRLDWVAILWSVMAKHDGEGKETAKLVEQTLKVFKSKVKSADLPFKIDEESSFLSFHSFFITDT